MYSCLDFDLSVDVVLILLYLRPVTYRYPMMRALKNAHFCAKSRNGKRHCVSQSRTVCTRLKLEHEGICEWQKMLNN